MQFDPSLLGLDDDLSDQYEQGHNRDGDDSDGYNNARRKKVIIPKPININYRNGETKTLILMVFQEQMNVKRNERKMYFTFLTMVKYYLARR